MFFADKLTGDSFSPFHFPSCSWESHEIEFEGVALENIVQIQLLEFVSTLSDVNSKAIQLQLIYHLLVLQ